MKNQKGLAQVLLLGLIAAVIIAAMSFGYVKYIKPKNENKNTNQVAANFNLNENQNLNSNAVDSQNCAVDSDCSLLVCLGCFNKDYLKSTSLVDLACRTYEGYACQCVNSRCTEVKSIQNTNGTIVVNGNANANSNNNANTSVDENIFIPPDRCENFVFEHQQLSGEYPYDYSIIAKDQENNRTVTLIPSLDSINTFTKKGELELITKSGSETPNSTCEKIYFTKSVYGIIDSYEGIYEYDITSKKLMQVDKSFFATNSSSETRGKSDNYIFTSDFLGVVYISIKPTERATLHYLNFITGVNNTLKTLPLNQTFNGNGDKIYPCSSCFVGPVKNDLTWSILNQEVKFKVFKYTGPFVGQVELIGYQTAKIDIPETAAPPPQADWVRFEHINGYAFHLPKDWIIRNGTEVFDLQDEKYKKESSIYFEMKNGESDQNFQIISCYSWDTSCGFTSAEKWLSDARKFGIIESESTEIVGFLTFTKLKLSNHPYGYFYGADFTNSRAFQIITRLNETQEVKDILSTFQIIR